MSDLREGFEQWLNSKFICADGGLNEWTKQFEYVYPHVQSMWGAWQASRQHDGHAEFVRAVRERVNEIFHCADSASLAEKKAIKLLALCDAELAKENSNG